MIKNIRMPALFTFVLIFTIMPWSFDGNLHQSPSVLTQNDSDPMGPYDIAILPLEDVPDPGEDVYHIAFNDYRGVNASAEVLRVLKDPRDIPLERFLYFIYPKTSVPHITYTDPQFQQVFDERAELYGQVVSYPDTDEILQRFTGRSHSAIAVYIRTTGAIYYDSYTTSEETPMVDQLPQVDPFYVRNPIRDYEIEQDWNYLEDKPGPPYYNDWAPWSYLAVSDTESSLMFPCMPQWVDDFAKPFESPFRDATIDPSSYLPPKPWYTSSSLEIQDGEVREGWMLCLAPDVPVDEIEFVRLQGYTPADEVTFSYTPTEIVWTYPNYKQSGDWHLMTDIEVIGWNNAPLTQPQPAVEPEPVEVHKGDVWVSMTSAMSYYSSPESQDILHAAVGLQIYFEGLDQALSDWDNLAIQDFPGIDFCTDKTLSTCSAGKLVGKYFYLSEPIYKVPISWIEIPDYLLETYNLSNSVFYGYLDFLYDVNQKDILIERDYSGQIRGWQLEAQDFTIPELTTHAICELEEVECLPEDIAYVEYHRGHNTFDGPLPIIPFGQSANGIRVIDTHIVDDPVLFLGSPHDLDLKSYEAGELTYQDEIYFIVDLEMQGSPSDLLIYQIDNNGIFTPEGGSEMIIFSNTGPFLAIGYRLSTEFISGSSNIGSVGSPPRGTSINQLILMILNSNGGGPAYALH